jgi:ubiquinone biosynthesis protein COQ9
MNSEDGWAERTEQAVLDAALKRAARTGWNFSLVDQASRDCGLSRGDAELLLPHGARDLAALLSRRHDLAALASLEGVDPKTLKIRDRIARGVEARLEAAAADEGAAKRWAAFLTLPTNAALGLRLAWESADAIWRWAGDEATDENHYSKRAILAGILVPAMGIRLRDGKAAADSFVAARIENVMAFEKWKAGVKPMEKARSFARVLGRLRYGAGEPSAPPPEA